MYTYFYFIK